MCVRDRGVARSQEFATGGTKETVWGRKSRGRVPVRVWGRRSRRHMLNIRLNKIHKTKIQHDKIAINFQLRQGGHGPMPPGYSTGVRVGAISPAVYNTSLASALLSSCTQH